MRFTRSDRRAMLIVFVAILAAMGGILLDRWFLHPLPQPVALNEAAMDSLEQPWGRGDSAALTGAAQGLSPSQAAGTYAVPVTYQPETFLFDPNTADSTTLLRLGLAPWQVRSIYKYRARGGRFHTPEDFKRLYGMTPELWERLAPVIQIHPKYRYYTEKDFAASTARSQGHPARSGSGDSVGTPSLVSYSDSLPMGKFTTLTLVDLNTADTTLLKRIPGIASYRARQIVHYRERLGGFVSTAQLAEVEVIPEELYLWFKVETNVFRKLNVNTATVGQLGRHPYMGFTRARAIESYRRVHGSIHSLDELRLLPDFTEEVIARLQPYIEY
jgi:DNA uptake protein ComE-like DNA-binding protein